MASRFDFVPIRPEPDAAVAGELIVAEERRGAVVRRHEQVDVAVAVEIAAREAASDLRLREIGARGGRDIAKRAVALVQEQVRRLRVADVAADVADGLVDVAVGDDEIEGAVQIDVGEGAAEAERVARGRPDAGARRDVFVHARPVARYRPIISLSKFVIARPGLPGAVEVAGVDAHAGARLAFGAERQPGFDGDVLERAVAQVAIELVRLRVVGDEQIGPAVLVVVEHRDAQRLRARVEDAARRRDVFERAVAAIAEQPAACRRGTLPACSRTSACRRDCRTRRGPPTT